ncbi:MAG: hypothetical protein GFH27_549301n141 [Chloroflexi bacterium AL-W]|nr:hypothetical protein [Chloroflexi bacterium AL-N1]NOK68334.1 hypothetical protein [Chloroflexi bacterium AL-N10]NOK73980.1 hypothetical protein [Chloroflexi bacterium AL-N5]NOK82948.1 hypothetical protein [Chloroflexi bacterium AL-W]NOK90470.1 hypothetical protein [Chloroflexi bacterium AL-N15]
MSVWYDIDSANKTLMLVGEGGLSITDLHDLTTLPMGDPAWMSGLFICCDLRNSEPDFPNQAIPNLVDRHRRCVHYWGNARCAFVANSSVMYGICRMYTLYASAMLDTSIAFQVFRNIQDARGWLVSSS